MDREQIINQIKSKRSFLCVGLDADIKKIPSHLLDLEDPIYEFNKQITLVNFFATWCKPCRDEHAFIKKFANQEGINVIGINYKDNPEKAKKWLNNLGNPYSNIGIDSDGTIAIDWGVYGIPETFIVNSKGIIKYRHVGPITKKTYKKIYTILGEYK